MGRQAAQLGPMAQTLRAGHPAYGADRTRNLRLIRRFLQHVLPKGFVKVRYYGFFSSGNRPRLRRVRQLLGANPNWEQEEKPIDPEKDAHRCPHCGQVMVLSQWLPPTRNRSP